MPKKLNTTRREAYRLRKQREREQRKLKRSSRPKLWRRTPLTDEKSRFGIRSLLQTAK
jgi:hypothetical protein